METIEDFAIDVLGPRTLPSPLGLSNAMGDMVANYTLDEDRVLWDISGRDTTRSFERAGPREFNYFRGPSVRAGIVTCGGLCPGINNIIRGLVLQLWHRYGVRSIAGFRYGYRGLSMRGAASTIELNPDMVDSIHLVGGSLLGSSRGQHDPSEMVDVLVGEGIRILFCVGGDGTMRGARAICAELDRRKLKVSVIGVPKTIDNDIPFIERSFGFETAVDKAAQAIQAAHVEARGAPNGIGLVKLMGRHSGFIAAQATLASGEVNLTLIPEVPFELDGKGGLLRWLSSRLKSRGHAVIVVAEGAGQRHLARRDERDASGNQRLSDIGTFLKRLFRERLQHLDVNVKYIDPSYMIRAAPANPGDSIFCAQLAENAVHAAMAGKTSMVVGIWGSLFTHVPLAAATSGRKLLSVDGPEWRSVLDTTGQPAILGRQPRPPNEQEPNDDEPPGPRCPAC